MEAGFLGKKRASSFWCIVWLLVFMVGFGLFGLILGGMLWFEFCVCCFVSIWHLNFVCLFVCLFLSFFLCALIHFELMLFS